MKFLKYTAILASVFALSACIEDEESENSGDSNESYTTAPENLAGSLVVTNLQSGLFPWNNHEDDNVFNATDSRTKKWQTFEGEGRLIPVQINNVQFVSEALTDIEEAIGETIFDRTSLDNTPSSEVTYGMVFSAGTAQGPEGQKNPNFCGHVGALGGSVFYPSDFYNDQGLIDTVLQVNIGSDGVDCDLNVGIVKHEIIHALGFGQHFIGFGNGSRPFDNPRLDGALRVLYTNTHSSTVGQLNFNL